MASCGAAAAPDEGDPLKAPLLPLLPLLLLGELELWWLFVAAAEERTEPEAEPASGEVEE